jgi:hypothetical protein
VKLVFNSGKPRIHYLLNAPELFREEMILRIETRIHVRPQIGDPVVRIPNPAVRNQDAKERRQAGYANRQHKADQLRIRAHEIHYRSRAGEIITIQYGLPANFSSFRG